MWLLPLLTPALGMLLLCSMRDDYVLISRVLIQSLLISVMYFYIVLLCAFNTLMVFAQTWQ